jgi:hypothetical protein
MLCVSTREVLEGNGGEALVGAVDLGERLAGAKTVIEQRVVEIKENGSQHGGAAGVRRSA